MTLSSANVAPNYVHMAFFLHSSSLCACIPLHCKNTSKIVDSYTVSATLEKYSVKITHKAVIPCSFSELPLQM